MSTVDANERGKAAPHGSTGPGMSKFLDQLSRSVFGLIEWMGPTQKFRSDIDLGQPLHLQRSAHGLSEVSSNASQQEPEVL